MDLDKIKFLIENNISDEPIIVAEDDENRIYLNSRYNIDEFVDIWSKQYDISNPFSIAVVVGVSDGRYVRKLHEMNKDMCIFIYEPYKEIAKLSHELGFLKDVDTEKVFVLVGEESLSALSHTIGCSVDFANKRYVNCFISPNYERIAPDAVSAVVQMVTHEKNNAVLSCNTLDLLGENFKANIAKNLLDKVEQFTVADLINKITEMNKKNLPAIIVAAGPSLDKNIKELPRAKGRAFIIAVDTALPALAKENIVPDICVTIDPIKPVSLFSNEIMREIPLVYHLASNHDILTVHKGKRFYQDSDESIYDIFINKYGKERRYLETGGSVANDACSLACFCKFSTIIFIGQDLAYPNDKEHSDNSYGKARDNKIDLDKKKYFYVEDVEGNMVRTEYNMNMYRLWFENEATINKDIKFIDATEGGAKIHGMDIMTLKDAIDEYCNPEEPVDFAKVFDKIEPAFTKEERKEILEFMADFENEVRSIKKRLRQGITYYDTLEDYNRKQIYSGKGFDTAIKHVTEVNNWIATGIDIGYLKKYVSARIFEVMDRIYEEKETVYEEIKLVVDNGKESLENLLKAIDEVLVDYQDNISKAKEMLKEYEGEK